MLIYPVQAHHLPVQVHLHLTPHQVLVLQVHLVVAVHPRPVHRPVSQAPVPLAVVVQVAQALNQVLVPVHAHQVYPQAQALYHHQAVVQVHRQVLNHQAVVQVHSRVVVHAHQVLSQVQVVKVAVLHNPLVHQVDRPYRRKEL